MGAQPGITPAMVDRIKGTLAALRMPCALEILDALLRIPTIADRRSDRSRTVIPLEGGH